MLLLLLVVMLFRAGISAAAAAGATDRAVLLGVVAVVFPLLFGLW